MTTLNPAFVSDGTGTYRANVLASPADATRLQGEYIEADDMYRRAGTGRADWVQLTGSVLIERLGEDGKPADGDVLLASEFNARFRSAVPIPAQ